MAELEGRPIAVTGGYDRTVRVLDLAERRALGDPLTGHTSAVTAVAVAELEGRPIAVTGSHDKTVRLWDLKNRRCLDGLAMPGTVQSLALGSCGMLVVGYDFDIATFDLSAPMSVGRKN